MKDPTARFTDRVANYVKYRPRYPKAAIAFLERKAGLRPSWTIADVGSGTGISSGLFLDAGCRVLGVEPNAAMREAAESAFAGRPSFRSIEGRAEATGLEAGSVELYVSGQAFHWFDRPAARAEALRILASPKRALLMWNDWKAEDSPFFRDYDRLLRTRMPGRSESDHRNLGSADFDAFFGRGRWEREVLPNPVRMDLEGLRGRLLSASYSPKPGDSGYGETMAELEELFARHESGGEIEFAYSTVLYLGEIGGAE